MSVIIRLQNLPWSANALDIRQYFRGLSIPEGGVHIVGGELGDAFIAFSTDEDARQAFQLNNGKIKEIQINLLLSSRTEMQKVIEAARTAQTTPFMQTVVPAAIPAAVPLNTSSSSSQEIKKEDGKESKSREREDSKSRRGRDRRRSRSRTRSRDRKDRSRDRRDRRRRERTRSRDRRDRRRDRRGRSRSRERTRSRDRDSRRSKDDKKDIKTESKTNDISLNDKKDDGKTPVRIWEQKINTPVENKPPSGLLGNFPAPPASLEEARRSLGLITGLQTTITPPMNDMNNRFQHNDVTNIIGARDNNWQRNNRFPDIRKQMPSENVGPGIGNSVTPNLPLRPPLLNQNLNQSLNQNLHQNINHNIPNPGMLGMDFRPNIYQMQGGLRMPLIQDNGFGMNAMNISRPFLNRPGTTFPDQFGNQERNTHSQPSQFMNNNRNDDAFRNDPKNKLFNAEYCVQLRPYFGGYGEVRKFFHGIFINNTGLKFVTDVTGKRNGIVFVRFVRPDGKEQALSRSGMLLRGVPVEVLHLDDEEFERYGDSEPSNNDESQESRNDPDVSSPRPQQRFTCVIVDDLPEFAKEHDILKLFSEYAILSVHMLLNKQYRPIAYAQFVKEEDATKAINDKKSHVIGAKPVTISPISKEIFDGIQKQSNGTDLVIDENSFQSQNETHSSSGHEADNFQGNGPPKLITDSVLMTGMPHKTTERDVIDFFSDIGLIPVRIHMLLGKFGPSGECYCEFNNPDEAVCALDKNGMPLGAGTVRVELFPRKEMERNLGFTPMNTGPGARFQNRFGSRGPNMMGGPRPPLNMMNRRPPRPAARYDGPLDQMGPAGCVINMENVPFKAGVNEILDFFEQFELSSQNVFRRFNDNGSPTGDARVTFNSPAEAHRALEECNKLKMRDRTVYLRIL